MGILIGVTDHKSFVVTKRKNPAFANWILAPRVSGHPDLLDKIEFPQPPKLKYSG